MNDSFDNFLLKEYENIAKAHFESQKQFALFFRYYTLFFSVPLVVLSILYREDSSTSLNNSVIDINTFWYSMVVLSIIGFLFYWFAITVKYEAVLYARTVNGIRNYFYQKLPSGINESEIRTLPRKIDKPKYKSLVNPVLLIIAMVNTIYLFIALKHLVISNILFSLGITILFFVAHFILNLCVTKNQKKAYP
ncbi:MAG TPA: hypothetical protein VE978_03915 [Chitinophagales bacterium]|nr:hypothetical protein [Chitinophagales bacterium]